MKAKQKKRLISLLALALVLAALIVGYFAVTKLTAEEEGASTDDTASTSVKITDADSALMTSLTYTSGDGELSFEKLGGVWYYTEDDEFPVKQSVIESMANAVSSITADRELAEGDTGEYGFDTPVVVVKASYSDGKNYVLTVGNTNSFNSKVYLKDQDGKVYLFADAMSNYFTNTLKNIIELDDPLSDYNKNYAVDVTVLAADGTRNVISDTDGIASAVTVAQKLDCMAWVDYAMDEAAFAEYGIGADSAKLSVNYKTETAVTDAAGTQNTTMTPKTYEFTFGNTFTEENEEGESVEYVYYTVSGSEILYKAELAVYDEVAALLAYTPPETAETEEATESADE